MALRLRVIGTVFAITAVTIVASTLVIYWFGNRVLKAQAREEVRSDVIDQLAQLVSTVKDAETGQRGFIITGEERYLEPYNDAVERLRRDAATLKSVPRIDLSAEDADKVARLIQQKMAELHSTIELRRTGGFDAATSVIRKDEGKRIMDDLRAEIARLQAKETAALKEDVRKSIQATRVRSLVFLLMGLLDMGILAWAYRRITEAFKERDTALGDAHKRGLELQAQKDLLGVTLASIGDGVMVTDKHGRITFMNRVAEELTGWRVEEATGRGILEVFHILNERTRQPVQNPVEKVIEHGVIVGLANDTLLIRKDGSEIPIDDSGAPIRDADGTIRGVVLVFRDFSEHKRAEIELREAKEAAETANKAKDQFLAMLSHELRTPLTPVLATLNRWEATEDIPESLQSDVQMLRRSVELEARIIDDLLDLTRIAHCMLSLSAESIDVHALIKFLIGLSQSELQNKELKTSLQLSATRHNVHTDAARLQQVVWNILRNAIKFTENGGNVSITTFNDAENNIYIVVADTGIGMTQETVSKLFVPFEQADPERHRRYGGLGLGLAISNSLIHIMEGKLTAKSEGLGRGSTFTVTLPTTEAVAPISESARMRPRGGDKIKLLLVEDHVDTARALFRLLENRGYDTETVSSVATALEKIERGKFDLILCDLGLPDGTGIDLIKKVRRTHSTPAIALTGFGMQEDVDRAAKAGFDAHLTKPVDLQRLEATIWKLSQNRQYGGTEKTG